jgi:pyruvate dehydrogenase E2 component (dihydrolipoamide acetyltransferase)
MPINIQMPALSPTMEEGTLAKWLVKEGDTVESGDVMAEIETDKATMEFEAVDEGIIGKILVPEGSSGVKVNEIIAILLDDGEDVSNIEVQEPENKQGIIETINTVENKPSIKLENRNKSLNKERVFATPLARRIAKSNNLELTNIKGTGPYGRIVKADVETNNISYLEKPATLSMTSSTTTETIKDIYKDRHFKEIALDGMRTVIANRLTEAKQTIPHFYLRRSCFFRQIINDTG